MKSGARKVASALIMIVGVLGAIASIVALPDPTRYWFAGALVVVVAVAGGYFLALAKAPAREAILHPDRQELSLEEILGRIAPSVLTIMNVASAPKDILALREEMRVHYQRLDELAALFASEPEIKKAIIAVGQLGGGAVSLSPRVPLQLFERFEEARAFLEHALMQRSAVGRPGDAPRPGRESVPTHAGFISLAEGRIPAGVTVALRPLPVRPTGYHAGVPDHKIDLMIDMDFVNDSQEVMLLHEPELIEFEVTGNLVKRRRPSHVFTDAAHHAGLIRFPLQISGKSRSIVRCILSLRLTYDDRVSFSPTLFKAPGEFVVSFRFVSEDLKHALTSQVGRCSGDFGSLKEAVTRFWKHSSHRDYLDAL